MGREYNHIISSYFPVTVPCYKSHLGIVSPNGSKLCSKGVPSMSQYLEDVSSGKVFHWQSCNAGGPTTTTPCEDFLGRTKGCTRVDAWDDISLGEVIRKAFIGESL